jgi:hypothetical protein
LRRKRRTEGLDWTNPASSSFLWDLPAELGRDGQMDMVFVPGNPAPLRFSLLSLSLNGGLGTYAADLAPPFVRGEEEVAISFLSSFVLASLRCVGGGTGDGGRSWVAIDDVFLDCAGLVLGPSKHLHVGSSPADHGPTTHVTQDEVKVAKRTGRPNPRYVAPEWMEWIACTDEKCASPYVRRARTMCAVHCCKMHATDFANLSSHLYIVLLPFSLRFSPAGAGPLLFSFPVSD